MSNEWMKCPREKMGGKAIEDLQSPDVRTGERKAKGVFDDYIAARTTGVC